MLDIFKIEEDSLPRIKEKFQLTGVGNRADPIVIDSLFGSYNAIKLKNILSHIIIKNIDIYDIRIINSRNIIIENCNIFRLDINSAQNITIEQNKIMFGELKYCRESLFGNNIFHPNFAALNFSEKGSKKGDLFMKKFQKQVPIVLSIPILFLEIMFFLSSILQGSFIMLVLSFLLLSLFIIPLIPIIQIQLKKKFIKNLGPNKFENNWYDTMDNLPDVFQKQR